MPPKNRDHYAGATGTISPSGISKLGGAFVVQPKMDGAYCHVHLDSLGCISRISSRTGRDFGGDHIAGLLGQLVGYPGAVLIGELAAHTEAGNRDAEGFGARRVHLFDCAFGMDSRPMFHMPYSERRDELCRMQAAVECYGPSQVWRSSAEGTRDRSTGWFCKRTARGTALTPLVPQFRPSAVSGLWDQVSSGELEGLVAVSLNAKLGARSAKRKCKKSETLDALVIGVNSRTVECSYLSTTFFVGKGARDIRKCDVVEVVHNGWYDRGSTPRFARISRVRQDLMVDYA